TPVPIGPTPGVNAVTAGAATTVKRTALQVVVGTVPNRVVTHTGPFWAPTGTTADTWVADTLRNEVARAPPKATCLAPARPLPSIRTVEPMRPATGVSPVLTGLMALRGGVAVMATAGGGVGGQASTVALPLKLPAASTKLRMRLLANASGAAVNVGLLKTPLGMPMAWVRGSMPGSGKGSRGWGVASQGPMQPPGLRRRSR